MRKYRSMMLNIKEYARHCPNGLTYILPENYVILATSNNFNSVNNRQQNLQLASLFSVYTLTFSKICGYISVLRNIFHK